MDYSALGMLLACIFLSALFSGIEIAFVATNKLHIELQGKRGTFSAKVLSKFARVPDKFIATALVGNNLTVVIYGLLMTLMLTPWLSEWIPNDLLLMLAQTVISTFILLFLSEYLPKSIFLLNPYRLLAFLAVPLLLIYYLFYPAVWLVMWVSKLFIIHIMGLEYSSDTPVFKLTDLNNYMKRMTQDQQQIEGNLHTKYFGNALNFKTMKVRDCMIPRPEIIAVDIHDTLEALKQQFITSGHSKIMVYNESIDAMVGYCHALDLFKAPKSIRSICKKMMIVPETMAANELLLQLIANSKTIALVVDEYGGTSGIVSIEDIIEEIFGEIEDEYDGGKLLEQKINEHEYLLSARQEIDYLNETYAWQLPEGEYDTLGGLILHINKNLPTEGQTLLTDRFSFEILLMKEARIEHIKLTIKPKDEE